MQGGQMQFKIDRANLIKAGTIPVIAAAVAGALWLLGFLGGLLGIFVLIIPAFAGYWYVNLVLKSGAKPTIVDVAINGAILGAATNVVYSVIAWIAISIRFSGLFGFGFTYGFGNVIGDIVQGAIAGAIGAGAWYAYKSGMIKTS
jgi:hypothetical protein